MSRQHRKWSEAQKLQILQEAEQHGQMETLRKFNLAHSLFLRWRKAYNASGAEGLKTQYRIVDPELRRLEQENERKLLCWSGLSPSSYYYRPKVGRRGRSPSTHTMLTEGGMISNESVVIAIRFLLAEEFMIETCKDV